MIGDEIATVCGHVSGERIICQRSVPARWFTTWFTPPALAVPVFCATVLFAMDSVPAPKIAPPLSDAVFE